ncbi:MAG: Zn-dependent hydrolase [Bacteroidales bacterium]|nr:Zn-dependent hydrolase [Bacteroidales bacterium]
MKKIFVSVLCALALTACGGNRDAAQEMLDDYADIQIGSSFFEGISDNGREVLNYFKLASVAADDIYWKQNFGDKKQMTSLSNHAQKELAAVNYGPWNRIDGQSFVDGWGVRPLGANFYPADMTAEEFADWDEPLKNSPYTLVRRDSEGKLSAVWYHDEYKEEIGRIASYLTAAANYTIKPSVREYLLAKIAALQTDEYYESDKLWLSMDDSKMDLIIGPQETEDDRLNGVKTSYEAYVLLKDLELTASIDNFTSLIPELQASLPCDEAYKAFSPGSASSIYAYDAVYCAGSANAGVKKIAVNLPYDLRVQQEMGTRTALLNNVINAKYAKIILPAGRLLLAGEQTKYLDHLAFFWNTAMREVAHGIGVKETVNGRGTVLEALGDEALTMEELKGDALGLYLDLQLIASGQMDPLLTREDAITTYVVTLIRSSRFGEANALGSANIILYNYLKEQGGFSIDRNGHYAVDFDKAERAITDIASRVLTLQATGDRAAALKLVTDYGTTSESLSQSFAGLRQARIPMDVRFQFVW